MTRRAKNPVLLSVLRDDVRWLSVDWVRGRRIVGLTVVLLTLARSGNASALRI